METYHVIFQILNENEKWITKSDNFKTKGEKQFMVVEKMWKEKYKDIAHKILISIENLKKEGDDE